MSLRAGSLVTSAVALFIASLLYAGCGLDVNGASLIDTDASPGDDAFVPTPDGPVEAASGDAEPRTCHDGFQDGDETDVDCGGMICVARCGQGLRCRVFGDCTTKACDPMTMRCVPPTCMDHVQNGDETDVDCGGSCTQKCGDGKSCKSGPDCASAVCTGGKCAAPTCMDGVKNGTETDVDCGGSCPACGNQKGCKTNPDCQSLHCQAMVCVDASCTDSIKDGMETDVDCGGPQCAPCGSGQHCAMPTDCASRVCTATTCRAPTCSDGVRNGSETDVDCGGGACPPCAPTKACLVGPDCTSIICNANVCQPPTVLGTVCTAGANCASGNCVDSTCCSVPQSSCNGCKACNLGGGVCANVPANQDPHAVCVANAATCEGARCAGNGTCNAADGTACGAPTCAGGTETTRSCVGGSCTSPTISCAPYVCNGAVCSSACTDDSGCIASYYCDQGGTCQPRKLGGAACNTTSDCKVAGCRECDVTTGGCFDGFCCNAACGGACQACSVAQGASANGTCSGLSGTQGRPSCAPLLCGGGPGCPGSCSSDAQCVAGDYCTSAGTCAPSKAVGGTCNLVTDCRVAGCRECGASPCVDGYCCDMACSGSCQACSIAAGATNNGNCANVAAGAVGRPPCSPYVCTGAATCPATCASDNDCVGASYCDNNGLCKPRKTLGATCDTTADCKVAGCRECTISCTLGTCA